MDSRERTFLTLEHGPADRLPRDFWASDAMIRRIEAESAAPYAAFLDAHDVDLRYIPGPRYGGPPLGQGRDIWGVLRREVQVPTAHGTERYSEVAASPLAGCDSVESLLAYPGWPSPDHYDYGVVREQCRALREAGRVVCFMGDRLNRVAQLKPAMYLRGIEQALLDLALRTDLAEAVIGRIRAFYRVYLERVLEAAAGGIDIVVTGDDFGGQGGLLVSPGTWRRMLQPGFAEYLRIIAGHGALSMHHTCGAVAPLIPAMIACGLDVLQSVQPEAAGMALGGLIDAFGGQIAFHGGISIQRTLPFGSPDDVRREVQAVAGAVAGRGGYILCTAHNIQADTPTANVRALLAAYEEYGRG